MIGPDRARLQDLFRSALAAVDPAAALSTALDASAIPLASPAERVWVLALGKAARPMAAACVAWLDRRGREPAGGLIVSTQQEATPHRALRVVAGAHPLPGPASHAAAAALEETLRHVVPGDEVLVLLSGGASSLIAAPVRGITAEELRHVFEVLLGSGLEIGDVNRVRKRVSRWAGGRLAVALAHASVRPFVVSDVIDDDVSAVGSGPCSPDPSRAVHVRALLDGAGLLDRMPASLVDLLERTERGMVPETPKPADPAFRDVVATIVANNRVALDAAAAAARQAGLEVRVRRKPVRGEAAPCGEELARRILGDAEADPGDDAARAVCYLAGGETVVTLEDEYGRGGRCQELALAAARPLANAGTPITLLAAGTDGRDGPTDAAGAIVDNGTWARILAAGRDPAADLGRHDAYAALDAAGELLRTGPTHTNVADLVFAIRRAPEVPHQTAGR